jgi:hypothetical protein
VAEEQGIYRSEVMEIFGALADIESDLIRVLQYLEEDDEQEEEEEDL